MTVLIIVLLTFTGVTGTLVVLEDDPSPQAVLLAVLGLVLSALFVVLQAPDVALSQVGIGAAVVPLMVLLAIRTIRRNDERRRRKERR